MSIKIHYTFIIYLLILFFFELLPYYFCFFISIFIHEISHGIMGKIFGLKIKNISINFSGLSLGFENFNISKIKKIIIYIVGPVINLIIAIILNYYNNEEYAFLIICNLLLFTFNILPIYPLDGGKIIYEVLSNNIYCDKLFNLIQQIFCIILILFCIYVYINFEAIQILFLGLYLLGMSNLNKYNKYFFQFR